MSAAPGIVPVILAGGGGSRLWPISTTEEPKQLLALVGRRTLLQETALRFPPGENGLLPPVVVTGRRHAAETGRQLEEAGIPAEAVLVEPAGRNTAPAVAVAAHHVAATAPGALMLVLPADHHLGDQAALRDAVRAGAGAAADGALVTFGVVPTRPETGYGYIERGEGAGPVYPAARFLEKPKLEVARELAKDGRHYWNAGIFLFSPAAILDAMADHAPEVAAAAARAVEAARASRNVVRLDADAFAASPSISIDHAVMEKAGNVAVVPIEAGWSDVGSLASLWEASGPDAAGNAARGFVLAEDVEGCYLRADEGLVAAIGLRDLAVVKSGDVVLVAPLARSQDVRPLRDRVTAPPPGRPEGVPAPVSFSPAAARLRDWLIGEALPAWGERAWDEARGGFHERMTLDGRPRLDDDRKRLRVQARQIFVCCTAHDLGLEGPFLDLARRGFAFLRETGWQETGGFPHLFTPDCAVMDPMRDAYDHAFVLYAMAALYRTTGDERALAWARRTMAYVEAAMGDDRHGGFLESAPPVLPRRANPHMHLLEAFLALFDATHDFVWLDRARDMVDLFRRVFLDRESGTLREFFAADWAPAEGLAGRIREPGHHWEWAFLLGEYEARSGEDCGAAIDSLTGFALAHGHAPATGLAHDEVLEDGTLHAASHRLWPQTEALRGLDMLRRRGRTDVDDRLGRLAAAVHERFIAPAPGPGMWVDQVAADGTALAEAVPASSFYHLVTGILALE